LRFTGLQRHVASLVGRLVVYTYMMPTTFFRVFPFPANRALYSRSFSARIVLTHSTHCAKLIPALDKLCSVSGIRSIVPGRLATARCNTERLEVRVSVPLHNGHKLIARKGTQVQEVFVVTQLSASDLKREVERVLAE
jgi:hypothetical protein